MAKIDNIQLVLEDVELVRLEGFDRAVIGVDLQRNLLVYSQKEIVSILMDRHHWDYDEALHYFDYNVAPLGLGDRMPIVVDDDWYD